MFYCEENGFGTEQGNELKKVVDLIYKAHREFFGVCEEIIKTAQKENPKIIFINKEKLYRHAMETKLTKEKWKKYIVTEALTRPDHWRDEKRVKAYQRYLKKQGCTNVEIAQVTKGLPAIEEEPL